MKNYTDTIIICHKLLSDPLDSTLHFSLQFVSSTVFMQIEEKAFCSSILMYSSIYFNSVINMTAGGETP